MLRAFVLVIGIGVTMTHACQGKPGEPGEPSEAPRSEPPMVETQPTSTEPLEPLALRCDGAALAAAFATHDLEALARDDTGASVRLLALWEAERRFGDDMTIERAAVDRLVAALTAELGQAPPQWWVEQLASAKQREGDESGPPYYDVGLTESGDRRGLLVPGPGSTRVRPDLAGALAAADGKLFFDLSMGRLELGPLPEEPGITVELGRARAGSTVYYASFSPAAGGFRFPLRAVGYDRGLRWEAEICGPDRQFLGGLGYLTVEIVVLEPPPAGKDSGAKAPSPGATGIAVWTAESHGVALDVLDPQTGARTLAWSSDFWFSR